MEFFDWTMLGTGAGAAFAVAVLTQLTKNIRGVKSLPTQLWSYILAVVVLLGSMLFTQGFSASGAGLAVVNAAMVSLAANGGYAAIQRVRAQVEDGDAGDGPEGE